MNTKNLISLRNAEVWQQNETSIVLKMLENSLRSQDIISIQALKRYLLGLEHKSYKDNQLLDDSLSLAFQTNASPNRKMIFTQELAQNNTCDSSFCSKTSGSSPSLRSNENCQSLELSPLEEEYLEKAIKQNIKQYDHQINITIIGNERTGKTSLMQRFTGLQFELKRTTG